MELRNENSRSRELFHSLPDHAFCMDDMRLTRE